MPTSKLYNKPTWPPEYTQRGVVYTKYIYWWSQYNDWHPGWNPTYRWDTETQELVRHVGGYWVPHSHPSMLVQKSLFE